MPRRLKVGDRVALWNGSPAIVVPPWCDVGRLHLCVRAEDDEHPHKLVSRRSTKLLLDNDPILEV